MSNITIESDDPQLLRVGPGLLFFYGPGNVELLRFEPDGRVFVRDELVDSNVDVYRAFSEWLAACRADPASTMNQNGRAYAEQQAAEKRASEAEVARAAMRAELEAARAVVEVFREVLNMFGGSFVQRVVLDAYDKAVRQEGE